MIPLDIIQQFFNKYKIFSSLSPDLQNRIVSSRKRILVSILKKHDSCSLFRSLTLSLFFLFRSLGKRITVASSALVMRTFSYSFATVVVIASVFTLNTYVISPKPVTHGTVVFAAGDVHLLRENQSLQALKVKDRVWKNDTIKTGANSRVAIELEDKGVLMVMPKTTSQIVSLINTGRNEVSLRGGKILSKILKDSKGTFKIKTPNCIAAVRGTTFSVVYNRGVSIVSISEGVLEIIHLKDNKKYKLTAGNTAVISQKYSEFPASDKELEELKELGRITSGNNNPSNSASEGKKSLAAIRESCGRIDVILTYRGKRYTGCILSRGSYYKVETANGIITIPKNDIRKVIVR